jgi:hypothetical protein
MWTTVAEGMALYEIPQENTVTYKHQDARSVTVSGTRGISSSTKSTSCPARDQISNSIYLEYPAVRKKGFDALVTHVAHSLRPVPAPRAEQRPSAQTPAPSVEYGDNLLMRTGSSEAMLELAALLAELSARPPSVGNNDAVGRERAVRTKWVFISHDHPALACCSRFQKCQ